MHLGKDEASYNSIDLFKIIIHARGGGQGARRIYAKYYISSLVRPVQSAISK
jgi:hypothetical protein